MFASSRRNSSALRMSPITSFPWRSVGSATPREIAARTREATGSEGGSVSPEARRRTSWAWIWLVSFAWARRTASRIFAPRSMRRLRYSSVRPWLQTRAAQ